jgi:hypothetical protein
MNHSGIINTSESWLVANNPHVIVGNITLGIGVAITLSTGVLITNTNNYTISALYNDINYPIIAEVSNNTLQVIASVTKN